MARGTRSNQINNLFWIGIPSAEQPGEPVSTSLHKPVSIDSYLELSRVAVTDGGSDSETILNKGREPRGLGLITASHWATDYFDIYGALRNVFSG